MGEHVPAYNTAYSSLLSCSTRATRNDFTPKSASAQEISNVLSDLSIGSTILQAPTNVFNSLDPSENILLLTPYLHAPPPHLAHLATPIDPFENFGRRLSQYHANIRHVPYVPKHGMAEIHKHLLDEAGGVIIVVCEPPEMKDASSKQRLDGLRYQQSFAKAIVCHLEDEIPSVLVSVESPNLEHVFEKAVQLESWQDLEKAAEQVFEDD